MRRACADECSLMRGKMKCGEVLACPTSRQPFRVIRGRNAGNSRGRGLCRSIRRSSLTRCSRGRRRGKAVGVERTASETSSSLPADGAPPRGWTARRCPALAVTNLLLVQGMRTVGVHVAVRLQVLPLIVQVLVALAGPFALGAPRLLAAWLVHHPRRVNAFSWEARHELRLEHVHIVALRKGGHSRGAEGSGAGAAGRCLASDRQSVTVCN